VDLRAELVVCTRVLDLWREAEVHAEVHPSFLALRLEGGERGEQAGADARVGRTAVAEFGERPEGFHVARELARPSVGHLHCGLAVRCRVPQARRQGLHAHRSRSPRRSHLPAAPWLGTPQNIRDDAPLNAIKRTSSVRCEPSPLLQTHCQCAGTGGRNWPCGKGMGAWYDLCGMGKHSIVIPAILALCVTVSACNPHACWE